MMYTKVIYSAIIGIILVSGLRLWRLYKSRRVITEGYGTW